MGAIGAFGQGMGDQDIAAVWAKGKSWFKVPKSVKINFTGEFPENVSAKDIVLNMLAKFGANKLLGYSVELYGDIIDQLKLDDRITISSMATEMGAIIILFTPTQDIIKMFEEIASHKIDLLRADADAEYDETFEINASEFIPMVANPGHPHDDVSIVDVKNTKIDSAFIGSCTNGRIQDLRIAADVLKGRKVAPGVVLKIVPSTDEIWQQALNEGLISIFKEAGTLLANAGCAGCAAGQIGQNGPEEVTISTGNRNFPGKQGKGEVYLASPAIVAASAVAGYITTPDDMPDTPVSFKETGNFCEPCVAEPVELVDGNDKFVVEGKVWFIDKDDIDTDMIFHNRYLTITDIKEMGQYTFDNLEGYKDFAEKVKPGDIVVTAKNFGAGSSRQQAVDCFKALGVQCILAESYGAIYERNAINAAFPILTYDPKNLSVIDFADGDTIRVDFIKGELTNLKNNKTTTIEKFSDVQLDIYKDGGLLA
ncbi:MAG: hypothetical protein K8S00_00105 [Bacteroidales bacterium]|nr:hypothetical protein [Bacteroidales bacterium]